jgi:hypothetical protein
MRNEILASRQIFSLASEYRGGPQQQATNGHEVRSERYKQPACSVTMCCTLQSDDDGKHYTTRQRCHSMTDGQIHSFNKSSVQPSREGQSLQNDRESGICPKAHHVCDPHQLTPVAFFHLAIDQARLCWLRGASVQEIGSWR